MRSSLFSIFQARPCGWKRLKYLSCEQDCLQRSTLSIQFVWSNFNSYHPCNDVRKLRGRKHYVQVRGEIFLWLFVFGCCPTFLEIAREIAVGVIHTWSTPLTTCWRNGRDRVDMVVMITASINRHVFTGLAVNYVVRTTRPLSFCLVEDATRICHFYDYHNSFLLRCDTCDTSLFFFLVLLGSCPRHHGLYVEDSLF